MIFKSKEKVRDIVNEKKTIELTQVVDFFRAKYPALPHNSIDKLRDLRNQIVHKGTRIPEKKTIYFLDSIDYLARLYRSENIKHRTFLNKITLAKDSRFNIKSVPFSKIQLIGRLTNPEPLKWGISREDYEDLADEELRKLIYG
jgi:hypothetical protein